MSESQILISKIRTIVLVYKKVLSGFYRVFKKSAFEIKCVWHPVYKSPLLTMFLIAYKVHKCTQPV